MDSLPLELLHHIFSFCDASSLLALHTVCRRVRQLLKVFATDNELHSRIC